MPHLLSSSGIWLEQRTEQLKCHRRICGVLGLCFFCLVGWGFFFLFLFLVEARISLFFITILAGLGVEFVWVFFQD